MADTVQTRHGFSDPTPGGPIEEVLEVDVDTDAGGEGSFADISLNEPFEQTPRITATARTTSDEDSATATVSAGGTSTLSFSNLTTLSRKISTNDLDVEVTGRGSAADVGFSIDKVWYDESAGHWKVDITETEASATIDVEVKVTVEPDVTVQNATSSDFDLEVQNAAPSGTVTVEVHAVGSRVP